MIFGQIYFVKSDTLVLCQKRFGDTTGFNCTGKYKISQISDLMKCLEEGHNKPNCIDQHFTSDPILRKVIDV